MTVRVVLAVAFAFALVAAAQPAVDHATRTRDAASLRANTDRVVGAVTELQRRSDPGESLATAPRRTLRIDLPADASIAVREEPPRLVSQSSTGASRRRTLPVPVETCGTDRTLDGRVTLAYVDRPDGPVVLSLRGFIRRDEARASHACTPRPSRGGRT